MEKRNSNHRGTDYRASYLSGDSGTTEEFASRLASVLKAGDIILAFGDLGAGKTCFARGLARGLGVQGEVASPSFTYLREHRPGTEDGLAFYHFDCYRLYSPDDWYDMGFDEYLGRSAVVMIEWPERVLESLPQDCIHLHLEHQESDNERIIKIEWPSQRGEADFERLLELLADFQRLDE